MPKVEISIFEGNRELWSGIGSLPLEIGRQQEGDHDSLGLQGSPQRQRLVVAPVSARSIPRRALQVEGSSDDLKLVNIHPRLSFYVGTQSEPLRPGEAFLATHEIVVSLPDNRTVRVTRCEPENSVSPNLNEATLFRTIDAPVDLSAPSATPARLNELLDISDQHDRGRVAVDLVRSALNVVEKAAGSNEFFAATVSAVATMIDLDRALVVLRNGRDWIVRASCMSNTGITESGMISSEAETDFSRGLLQRVVDSQKTVLYDPAHFLQSAEPSMMVLDRAIAAPIFDEDRKVIGAIYGDRKSGSGGEDAPIGELEAALLEVMAGAVSSGIARQRQEAIRSNLTQFFSHEIAERLEQNEDLLAGKDADVSVLFCDIRGFSTIAERVGARRTIEWINDILTELSECVQRNNGVLVDYIGDEVMAMWGAPDEQPDHAALACQCAEEMLRLIDPLRERWHEITPDRFGLGIGISTGIARVGNTGSKVKFKYGPLGNTVNLASRVQGITKKLGVQALITEATAKSVGNLFACRRLASVRPVGIQEPVSLYELRSNADDGWRVMSHHYEQALSAFENSDLTGAARQLASLVHQHPDDNPSVVLLGRVVDALTQRVESVDPIWVLDSK